MAMPVPTVLSIAGSDPSGGAGIQADLKAIAAHRCYGMAVLTALTAQNTTGVSGVHEPPPSFCAEQLRAVLSDIGCDAAKTGMLSSAPVIEAVCDVLDEMPVPRLVVDPVMVAKSGDRLLAEDAVDALRERLLPRADLVTPNLPEAEVLCGFAIDDEAGMEEAARAIADLGPDAVLVKGGHREGPDLLDLLHVASGDVVSAMRGARIDTPHTHGTGCTYSAAIACRLARGEPLSEAVEHAWSFLREAIRSGLAIGEGRGPTNPLGLAALEAARA